MARGSSRDDLLDEPSFNALLSDVSAQKAPAHDFGTGASLGVQDGSTLDALLNDVSADEPLADDFDAAGPFYSHGYALRVRLHGTSREATLTALRSIEWEADSTDWRRAQLKHCQRWIVRGSTFITHRKPRNKRLPMAQFNGMWKTHLYSLVVEDDGGKIALTFHGVRRQDVETVLQGKMGLGGDDYTIEHYTALERYFVLAPHEALRLGAALGGVASNGGGRATRKRYLIRDLDVPMVVGERARRTAQLTIYRLRGGATAQYKVELRLKGRSRDRTHFSESDMPKLDAVLAQIIDEHALTPIAKPARWEPVTPTKWRRDGRLAVVGQSAYRGKAVDADRIRLAEVCHTPLLCFSTDSANGSLTSDSPEYIRKAATSETPSGGLPSRPGRPRGHRAWQGLAKDIGRFEGYLSEVILDPQQDPAPFVSALIEDHGDEVGVGMITSAVGGNPDTWGSIVRLATAHPIVGDTQFLVVLVDFSVVLAIEEGMFRPIGESLTEAVPGPLYPPYWQQGWGHIPPWEKAVAALMAPLFAELRDVAETTGLRIITITTDLRPDHGRGELLKTHRFRDGRVRSHVGDAGRHYAHLRYLVDSDLRGRPTKITMAKDEGEGLPGRIIWG
jgi:hypothetical protein